MSENESPTPTQQLKEWEEAISDLGFDSLGHLNAYIAQLSTIGLDGFLTRVKNRYSADSTEMRMIESLLSRTKLVREAHQAGGVPATGRKHK